MVKLRWLADPRSPGRKTFIDEVKSVMLELSEKNVDEQPVEVTEPFSTREDGSFICNLCCKVYKQLGYLKKHLVSNHNVVDFETLRCKKCNKIFDTKKKLTRHENMKSDCSKN